MRNVDVEGRTRSAATERTNGRREREKSGGKERGWQRVSVWPGASDGGGESTTFWSESREQAGTARKKAEAGGGEGLRAKVRRGRLTVAGGGSGAGGGWEGASASRRERRRISARAQRGKRGERRRAGREKCSPNAHTARLVASPRVPPRRRLAALEARFSGRAIEALAKNTFSRAHPAIRATPRCSPAASALDPTNVRRPGARYCPPARHCCLPQSRRSPGKLRLERSWTSPAPSPLLWRDSSQLADYCTQCARTVLRQQLILRHCPAAAAAQVGVFSSPS